MNSNLILRTWLLILVSLYFNSVFAQKVEQVYKPYINTIQLYKSGNQQGFPVILLNSGDKLELGFDDMEGSLKNYYYTFVLCDYNWQTANLNPFDYIKGFTQSRITTYRYSSIAYTKYTHYQLLLPEQNSVPSRSGNYLLKVFLDGDTSKLAFTKQFLVLDVKTSVTAAVVQPFTPDLFNTYQRIKFSAAINGLNAFSAAQQIKAVILQNNRWDLAQRDIPPTFVRGNALEYNTENLGLFPGGKEWRWLDLRSFRLQSDRVQTANYTKTTTDIFLKTDAERTSQRYVYYPDYNGMYNISTYETLNPLWQGDYATVYFSLAGPNAAPYPQKKVYLSGAFTNYELNDKWEMKFNDAKGVYELSAFLKQGYYNYQYVTVDTKEASIRNTLEGNYWETENNYTILLYYKSFSDRNDQLIGVSQIDSRADKAGFSY